MSLRSLAQLIAEFRKSYTFHVHFSVFSERHKFKVIYVIIKSVVINMMNKFVTLKFSSKKLFHYISMLWNSLAVNADLFISVFRVYPTLGNFVNNLASLDEVNCTT